MGHIDPDEAQDLMVLQLDKIVKALEKVLVGMYVCAGLLGLLAFLITLRLMLGR